MHKNNSLVIKRWIASLSMTFMITLSGFVTEPSYSQENLEGRFICKESVDEIPNTTVFQSSSGKDVRIIEWRSTYFSQSGFRPETRCQIVSKRLQEAFQSGNLKYFIFTKVRDFPVICASKKMNGDCDTLIFTLIEGEDYLGVLNGFTEVLNGLKRGSIAAITRGRGESKFYVNLNELVPQLPTKKSPSIPIVCVSRSANGNCSGLLIMQ